MENWTVYKHTCLTNGKVYIGITSREPKVRWGKNGHAYQKRHHPHFYNAIQKYGWDGFSHEILFTGLTKDEAESKEIELIALYKANDRRFGYNELEGGNCTTNPSAETRRKQSESRRGRIVTEETRQKLREANLGQKRSEETRRHMSESAKRRKRNPMPQEVKDKIGNANRGKVRSREQIEQMIENAPNKMPVNQYDLKGNFIRSFESASEASKELSISKTHILECCHKNTKTKSCGGFQWRFVDDTEAITCLNNQKAPKPVIQWTLDGQFVKQYESAAEAKRETKIDDSTIRKCCRKLKKSAGGYLWTSPDDF